MALNTMYMLMTAQFIGFPGGTGGKESACQFSRLKRRKLDPWVGKIPWRWAWPCTPVFLPGESHGIFHPPMLREEPGGLQVVGRKESDTTEVT